MREDVATIARVVLLAENVLDPATARALDRSLHARAEGLGGGHASVTPTAP